MSVARVLEEPSEAGGMRPEERAIRDALQAGDDRTALCLCSQHYGAVLGRFCMAFLHDSTEAEDLAQDTLLTAHAAFDEFRGGGSVRAWLIGIARNKCLKHLETRRRRTSKLRLIAGGATEASSVQEDGAHELTLSRQRAERARAALERMKPTERDALVLRYVAELSFREVAEACGIEEATARKRVSRALGRLRELVQEDAHD